MSNAPRPQSDEVDFVEVEEYNENPVNEDAVYRPEFFNVADMRDMDTDGVVFMAYRGPNAND